jgi:ABC-2 type transport system permease protein
MTPYDVTQMPGAGTPWQRGDLPAALGREFILLTRNRTNMLLSLVTPAAFILLFTTSMAGLVQELDYEGTPVSYAEFAIPGMMFMALLAAANSSGTALFTERNANMTLELLSYPLRRGTYVAAKLLVGTALVTGQTLLALAVAALLFRGQWGPSQWLGLLLGTVVAALAFNSLYLLLAAYARSFQRFMVIGNVSYPIAIFASPSIYPLSDMPQILQYVAWANPVTYGVTALRDGLFFGLADAWPYLTALAVLGVAGSTLVAWRLRYLARDL